MLQILGWLGCFYLVLKGVQVLQTGLASSHKERPFLIVIGGCTLAACVIGAIVFVVLINAQANSTSSFATPNALSTP
jgi:hypothetical protein